MRTISLNLSPHHQIVFTIPKMLRPYFRYDRKLMTDLSRAARTSVVKFMEQELGKEVTPAMVVVKHTYGEGVRFHPHLHTLVTAGGWDEERAWRHLPAWNQKVLRELFQIEVFRFLRERELLSRERMEMILSWRHSGFNIHISEAIQAGDKAALTRVARYMLRSPVVISRLSYDREGQKVKIKKRNTAGGDEIVLDVLDFIARLSVQIPDPHERIVLYYGPYSNASNRRRVLDGEEELTPPATGFSRSGES
ncbi:MAG: transposase [Candidatus Krumholzibacteriales bacterium]